MNQIEQSFVDVALGEFGLCVPEDPRLWDGIRVNQSRYGPLDFSVARAICSTCKVSNMCLERALETGDSGAMRGGKTPEELAELIKAQESLPVHRARVMA